MTCCSVVFGNTMFISRAYSHSLQFGVLCFTFMIRLDKCGQLDNDIVVFAYFMLCIILDFMYTCMYIYLVILGKHSVYLTTLIGGCSVYVLFIAVGGVQQRER